MRIDDLLADLNEAGSGRWGPGDDDDATTLTPPVGRTSDEPSARASKPAATRWGSRSSTSRPGGRATTSWRSVEVCSEPARWATAARSTRWRPVCWFWAWAAATKLLRYLSGLDKTYEALICLGTETDSLDADGEVTAGPRHGCTRRPDRVSAAAQRFVGEIEQVPPMVSAMKVDGRRLHELAREGKEVERAATTGDGPPFRCRTHRRSDGLPGHRRVFIWHLRAGARRRARSGTRRRSTPVRLCAAPRWGRSASTRPIPWSLRRLRPVGGNHAGPRSVR